MIKNIKQVNIRTSYFNLEPNKRRVSGNSSSAYSGYLTKTSKIRSLKHEESQKKTVNKLGRINSAINLSHKTNYVSLTKNLRYADRFMRSITKYN